MISNHIHCIATIFTAVLSHMNLPWKEDVSDAPCPHSVLPRGIIIQIHTESCRGANNHTLSLEFLGQVDLVTGRALDQDVKVRERVSNLDEGRPGVMEQCPLSMDARKGGGKTLSCEHGGPERASNERDSQ